MGRPFSMAVFFLWGSTSIAVFFFYGAVLLYGGSFMGSFSMGLPMTVLFWDKTFFPFFFQGNAVDFLPLMKELLFLQSILQHWAHSGKSVVLIEILSPWTDLLMMRHIGAIYNDSSPSTVQWLQVGISLDVLKDLLASLVSVASLMPHLWPS